MEKYIWSSYPDFKAPGFKAAQRIEFGAHSAVRGV